MAKVLQVRKQNLLGLAVWAEMANDGVVGQSPSPQKNREY